LTGDAAAINNPGHADGFARTSTDADRGLLRTSGNTTDLGIDLLLAAPRVRPSPTRAAGQLF
jgi:hypothetical protein